MSSLAPSGHPVVTKQFAAEIEGSNMDFLIAIYQDQIMITATQLDMLGTILQCR